MSKKQSVRAIDVGYGNTKFVVGTAQGDVQCDHFPSLVPLAATNDLGAGLLQRRSTFVVDVNGVRYEVGKDSVIAQGANPSRVLDPSFAKTDAYLALIRGAFCYMDTAEIGKLIVGLPVSTVKELGPDLERRLTGEHPIPAGNGKSQIVNVHSVKALAQPLGAFFDYTHRTNTYHDMKSQMNLIIDPGFFTLDWLLCKGIKPIDSRSNAHNGGMSSILRVLADEIGKRFKTQISDLSLIDNALRHNKGIKVFGKEFPLDEFKPLIQAQAKQAVSALVANVGSGVDIENILIAGGGATIYFDAIKDAFPHHDIKIARDPIYANVRGFQRAGDQLMSGPIVGATA
jgi:plasmid segregation protein ParM